MRIKELRRSAGLTQKELSQLLGVTRVTVANWELCRRHPPAKSLPLIAKTLNCSIDELYGESEKKLTEVKKDMSGKFNISEDIDDTIHSLCTCIQQEAKNYNNYSDEKALQEMTIALAELVKARVVNLSAPY